LPASINNQRPHPDQVLLDIVEDAIFYEVQSELAYDTARQLAD